MVSVIMTAFNRERFISTAIESVLASTYKNFELIIVDDFSTDSTVNIANHYKEKDSRIKVFINEQNLGDYPNRNRAASFAKGKYLKFVDSDDCIYPNTLTSMVIMMENFEEASWGVSNFYQETLQSVNAICLNPKQAYEYHYFKTPIFFASPSLVIFKKEAFDKVGGFSENRMVSDFEMWHKMGLKFPMVLMPGSLVWIRKHPDQEVADQYKYVLGYEQIKLTYLKNKECPLTDKQVITIIRNRINTVFKIFLRKLMLFNFKEAKPRFKVFCFYIRNYLK